MKQTAVAVLLLLLNFAPSRGQSIASNVAEPASLRYSTANFAQLPAHKKMCGAAKAGLITVGSGIVIGSTGVAFMFGNMSGKGHSNINSDNAHIGAGMFASGGLLEIIGGALILGATIHEHAHKKRITVISSGNQEMGIRYCF